MTSLPTRSAKHILLIEDDPTFQELISLVLAADGFDVVTAPNGADGLCELEEEPLPCLIVTDYMMPLMDGIEMAKRVRNTPRLTAIPILLFSSIDFTEGSAERWAYDIFLRKGCEIRDLLGTVRRMSSPDYLRA
jgi:two-component system, OmpR family, response regulator VicR